MSNFITALIKMRKDAKKGRTGYQRKTQGDPCHPEKVQL
jgi:hypothetical protein